VQFDFFGLLRNPTDAVSDAAQRSKTRCEDGCFGQNHRWILRRKKARTPSSGIVDLPCDDPGRVCARFSDRQAQASGLLIDDEG
jgi:hypothetical protein